MIRGFKKLRNFWSTILLVTVVNALIQSGLTILDLTPVFSLEFMIVVTISAVTLLLSLALGTSAALEAAHGPVTIREAIIAMKPDLVSFTIWAVAMLLIFSAGLIFYIVPGFIFLFLTPFTAIAAMAGKRNALKANFQTIAARPWRYLLNSILVAVILLVSHVLAAVNTLLIGGFAASIFVWVYYGILGAWILSTFAVIYRSAASPDSADAADPAVPAAV